MKQIQIKEQDIDWLKIIQLALDKQGWGEVYTLYTYGEVIITAEIEKFNFTKQKATFNLKITYEGMSQYSWITEKTIDYFLKNFTVENFKMVLQKSLVSFIEANILYDAKQKGTHIYIKDWHSESEVTDEIINASEYKEDYDIADHLTDDFGDDVKEKIIETIQSELNEYFEMELKAYKLKVLTTGEGMESENLYKLYNLIKLKVDDKVEG